MDHSCVFSQTVIEEEEEEDEKEDILSGVCALH